MLVFLFKNTVFQIGEKEIWKGNIFKNTVFQIDEKERNWRELRSIWTSTLKYQVQ